MLEIIIETSVGIFTIDNGKVKILLIRKKTEPYKGYWVLPTRTLELEETLDENIDKLIYNVLSLENVHKEQCYTFSELNRTIDDRRVNVAYLSLIDIQTSKLLSEENENMEIGWFWIKELPKMGYDHDEIINKLTSFFRERIVNSNILKTLFPSDFSLPELQKIYEQIFDIELDRRNFRKKFINSDLIEYTGYKNEGVTGRPAKLYRFKEQTKEKELF